MWIADKWTEYKVLDASDGEKLESWAGYQLVRPDPQVIWSTDKWLRGWRSPNAHYIRSSKGGGEWQFFDLPETWELHYTLGNKYNDNDAASDKESTFSDCFTQSAESYEICFHLKPFAFKHTGVFPEQAANWEKSYSIIRNRKLAEPDKPVKVLNLFAYTGGATISAAAAGAEVTHVDASKGMVSWAKENAASSGLANAPIRWLVDDCSKFVERELRRGNHYDAIIMDPPSYGRGPKGEIWKIEESIYPFIELCSRLLSEEPLFFLVNSYTTGLQPGVLKAMLQLSVQSKHGGNCVADELGLGIKSRGIVLPAGASGWWMRP